MARKRTHLANLISYDPLPFLLSELGVAVAIILMVSTAQAPDGNSMPAFGLFFLCGFSAVQSRVSAIRPPKTEQRSTALKIEAREILIASVLTLAVSLLACCGTLFFFTPFDGALFLAVAFFVGIVVVGYVVTFLLMSRLYR